MGPAPLGHISRSDSTITWTIDDFFSSLYKIGLSDTRSPVFEFANESWWFQVKPTLLLKYTTRDSFGVYLWKKEGGSAFNVRLGISGLHEMEKKGPFRRMDDHQRYIELHFIPEVVMHQAMFYSSQLTFFCEIYKEEFGAAEALLSMQEFKERRDFRRKAGAQQEAQIKSMHETEERRDFKCNVEQQQAPKSKSFNRLQGDFKELLVSGKNSDVILKVKGREFKAHRVILGIRSPAFSAMFQHDMSEKQSGVVDIRDCNPNSFLDFLQYLYTGKVDIYWENAFHLCAAADKYQVMELKEECFDFVKRNLSVMNFCDILSFSLGHCEIELTEIATEFFLTHASDIVQTSQWQKFLVQNPIAANKLYVKSLQANKQ